MADVILIDPLGRTVVLHDHTWHGHIVKGHPDIKGERYRVEAAVRNPQSIHFSKSDSDCRVYYTHRSASGILIAVVVDIANGLVKTAYRAAKTKGAVEWSPSKP